MADAGTDAAAGGPGRSGGSEILAVRRGGLAEVTLNRPAALNALDLGMCRSLDAHLAAWQEDAAVRAVLVRGAGGRAFCAGGDVRTVWQARRDGGAAAARRLGAEYFRTEYRLDRRVARFPKPYISVLDGITMGGGAGISLHGSCRIVSERLALAMPETVLGLFPDIGASVFLNRCPGRIGCYLGLTGARLGAADALYCGLATHYVPAGRLPELGEALAGLSWRSGAETDQLDRLVADFAAVPGPAPLAERQAAIDRCFAGAGVEAILTALERESARPDGAWAEAALATLARASPSSLKVTLRLIREGAGIAIEEALRTDYRVACRMLEREDFFEGVRAVLVDKDQAPHWRPATLSSVGDTEIAFYFNSLGEDDLTFP